MDTRLSNSRDMRLERAFDANPLNIHRRNRLAFFAHHNNRPAP
jgi:hypothetical protein